MQGVSCRGAAEGPDVEGRKLTDRERCPECRYGGGWHAEDCQTRGEPENTNNQKEGEQK